MSFVESFVSKGKELDFYCKHVFFFSKDLKKLNVLSKVGYKKLHFLYGNRYSMFKMIKLDEDVSTCLQFSC